MSRSLTAGGAPAAIRASTWRAPRSEQLLHRLLWLLCAALASAALLLSLLLPGEPQPLQLRLTAFAPSQPVYLARAEPATASERAPLRRTPAWRVAALD